jgi:hypothetical protein
MHVIKKQEALKHTTTWLLQNTLRGIYYMFFIHSLIPFISILWLFAEPQALF